MANYQNDYYLSQTYLSHFIDPNNPNYLYVYRKAYPKKSKLSTPSQICYEPNGDSNSFFPNNPRILDDFLRLVEPEVNKLNFNVGNYKGPQFFNCQLL